MTIGQKIMAATIASLADGLRELMYKDVNNTYAIALAGPGGGGGGGTQYAEDAVHVSGDLGNVALAVRKDTASALAADGDYIPHIVDSTGRLWVHVGVIDGTVTVGGTVTIGASVAVPAGEAFIGQVGGPVTNPSATFTRPGDTNVYASGDLVANSTTAGSVTAMSFTVSRVAAGSFMLRRLKVHKTGTSVTNAQFRLHLFRTAPATITNGDNGVFSVSGATDYLGAFDVTVNQVFTDGSAGFGIPATSSEMTVKLASGTTIAGLLEARAAYTPANAEVFTFTFDDFQN